MKLARTAGKWQPANGRREKNYPLRVFISSRSWRKDPHVIDKHRCREDDVRLRIAVEMTANGQVQNDPERLAKYGASIFLDLRPREHVVRRPVDGEFHVQRIPFDGVGVEITRAATGGKILQMDKRRGARVPRTMHRR